MNSHSAQLHPQKKTLRGGRALFYLLLRTSAWAAILLACGLYYLNETLPTPPVKPAADTAGGVMQTGRRPFLSRPPHAKTQQAAEMADPLYLIKASKAGTNAAGTRTAAPGAAAPRLKAVTFAGSGGRFVPLGQAAPEQGSASRTEGAPRDGDAVLLPAAALSRKVKVTGAKPVPAALGKKYSGIDPEAEFLRERLRRQAAAAEASAEQLRHEELLLTGWLLLLALAVMILPSRVIKAWRLIQKPEGSHWTLK